MILKVLNIHEDRTQDIFASPQCQEMFSIYDDYYPKVGFNLPWVGYWIIRENQVVGVGGFVSKPVDGEVEIAYGTFKDFEGQGVSSFTCSALVSISKNFDSKIRITAKTSPEPNASTKILMKNGFEYSKVVQDHEIGDAWFWILPDK